MTRMVGVTYLNVIAGIRRVASRRVGLPVAAVWAPLSDQSMSARIPHTRRIDSARHRSGGCSSVSVVASCSRVLSHGSVVLKRASRTSRRNLRTQQHMLGSWLPSASRILT
jgi:hypothetical protein